MLKRMLITIAALLFVVSAAVASPESGKACTTKSCCAEKAKDCCAKTPDCCKDGAKCCAEGAACCKEKSCRHDEASKSCNTGHGCCKRKTAS